MLTEFVGRVRKERAVGGFRVVETEYGALARFGRHAHENAYFYVVLGGEFTERLSHGSARYAPGWITYSAAGEPHATSIGEHTARCLMVQLPDHAAIDVTLPTPRRNGWPTTHGSELAYCSSRLVREFNNLDTASSLAVEGFILAILAQLSRAMSDQESPPPLWLEQVRQCVLDSYRVTPDAEQLARTAGVSRAHLSRAFRHHFKHTIGEFVRHLRLADAERALMMTDRPIGEVAHVAGFCDQSHFTRAFRRQTGLTPAAFRRLRRHTH